MGAVMQARRIVISLALALVVGAVSVSGQELTGEKVKSTYGDLVQLCRSGAGVAATTTAAACDGLGTALPFKISAITFEVDGDLIVGNGTDAAGAITLREDGDFGLHGVKIQAPESLAASYTLTLPNSNGNPLDFLQTDGSGVLSWIPVPTPTLAEVTGEGATTTTTITLGGASPLVLDGATAGTHATTISVTDPTAANAITVPDKSGTIAMTSDIPATPTLQSVTNSGASTTQTVTFSGALAQLLTGINAAGGGANPWDYTGTLAAMNGDDTFIVFDINLTNGNHSGTPASNLLRVLDVASITGDLEAQEVAILIGAGWDYGFRSESAVSASSLTVDSTFGGSITGGSWSDTALNSASIIQATGNIGAAPAATCVAGTVWIDTDETNDTNCTTTADNSLCLCVAANTWAALEAN